MINFGKRVFPSTTSSLLATTQLEASPLDSFFTPDHFGQSLTRLERSLQGIGTDPEFGRTDPRELSPAEERLDFLTEFGKIPRRLIQKQFYPETLQPKDIISQDEANELYGIEGALAFTEPVPREIAKLRKEIMVEQLRREDIANRTHGFINNVASFGLQMASEFTDPITALGMVMPIVNDTRVAAIAAKFGTLPARAGVGAFEGGVGMTISRLPHFTTQALVGEDPLVISHAISQELMYGAAFGAVFRPLLGKLSDKIEEIRIKQIYEDLGLDPKTAPKPDALINDPRVRFTEEDHIAVTNSALAQGTEKLNIDVTPEIEIAKARANKEIEESVKPPELGEVSENLRTITQDILKAQDAGDDLSRFSERLIENIENLAEVSDLVDDKTFTLVNQLRMLERSDRSEAAKTAIRKAAINKLIDKLDLVKEALAKFDADSARAGELRQKITDIQSEIKAAERDPDTSKGVISLLKKALDDARSELIKINQKHRETIELQGRIKQKETAKRRRIAPVNNIRDELTVRLESLEAQIKKGEEEAQEFARRARKRAKKKGKETLLETDELELQKMKDASIELRAERNRVQGELDSLGPADVLTPEQQDKNFFLKQVGITLKKLDDVSSGKDKISKEEFEKIKNGLRTDIQRIMDLPTVAHRFGISELNELLTRFRESGTVTPRDLAIVLRMEDLEKSIVPHSEDLMDRLKRVDHVDELPEDAHILDKEIKRFEKEHGALGDEPNFDDMHTDDIMRRYMHTIDDLELSNDPKLRQMAKELREEIEREIQGDKELGDALDDMFNGGCEI